MLTKISNRIIDKSSTLIQALKQMDQERVKLLFVFNEEQFISILTIGDIQRAIISSQSLNTLIEKILDSSKIYSTSSESFEEVKDKMLRHRTECMPVIDGDGNLIDVFFWEDIFEKKSEETREKIDIPTIIMAGGKGTRLQPLTNVIPKPLLPINEKTILEIILDKFETIGISRFYMSLNYKAELMKYYLDNIPTRYNIKYFQEEKPLGTIGSLYLLKDENIDTPFFVSNCDILIEQDFRDVYSYHINNKNDITIVSAIKTYPIPYGVLETKEDGIISGLKEKPEMSFLINTGVYILNPEMIREIPHNEFYHITHLIEKIRERGGRIGSFPISENSWTDIGEWNGYLKTINSSNILL